MRSLLLAVAMGLLSMFHCNAFLRKSVLVSRSVLVRGRCNQYNGRRMVLMSSTDEKGPLPNINTDAEPPLILIDPRDFCNSADNTYRLLNDDERERVPHWKEEDKNAINKLNEWSRTGKAEIVSFVSEGFEKSTNYLPSSNGLDDFPISSIRKPKNHQKWGLPLLNAINAIGQANPNRRICVIERDIYDIYRMDNPLRHHKTTTLLIDKSYLDEKDLATVERFVLTRPPKVKPNNVSTPLILLDIDGVLNRIGSKARATPVWPDETTRKCNKFTIRYSPTVVNKINEWSRTGKAEILWLTTWNENARNKFAPFLGLDDFYSARDHDNKIKSVDSIAIAQAYPDRRICWIDDVVGFHSMLDEDKIWKNRKSPTLLLQTQTHLGEEHLKIVEKFLLDEDPPKYTGIDLTDKRGF